jgi:hypothetical protein
MDRLFLPTAPMSFGLVTVSTGGPNSKEFAMQTQGGK